MDQNNNEHHPKTQDTTTEEQQQQPITKTKKKKKRSKKRTNKFKRISTLPNEEFQQWCSTTLTTTSSHIIDIPPEILHTSPPEFRNYTFRGNLRPAYVTPQLTIPSTISQPDYATNPDGRSATEELEKQSRITNIPLYTTEEEIQRMRQVCAIGREVLDIAGRFLKAGVTGDEIDRIVYTACIERNVYPSPLNYYRFQKSVCVSPNEIICHGIPDCREIEDGDIINIDISVYQDGYHADLNETFFIGTVDEDAIRVVHTAYQCLANIVPMIRSGTMYRDLGAIISKTAAQNQCTVVKTYCGHGVGRLFHCAPNIPHYAKNKGIGIMRPGHIFTVEPMINDGGSWGDVTWPDNWTSSTRDGKRSAQFEHTFLVTETGCEILTSRLGASKTEMPEWDEEIFQR